MGAAMGCERDGSGAATGAATTQARSIGSLCGGECWSKPKQFRPDRNRSSCGRDVPIRGRENYGPGDGSVVVWSVAKAKAKGLAKRRDAGRRELRDEQATRRTNIQQLAEVPKVPPVIIVERDGLVRVRLYLGCDDGRLDHASRSLAPARDEHVRQKFLVEKATRQLASRGRWKEPKPTSPAAPHQVIRGVDIEVALWPTCACLRPSERQLDAERIGPKLIPIRKQRQRVALAAYATQAVGQHCVVIAHCYSQTARQPQV